VLTGAALVVAAGLRREAEGGRREEDGES
jgi:hypothetical protein